MLHVKTIGPFSSMVNLDYGLDKYLHKLILLMLLFTLYSTAV